MLTMPAHQRLLPTASAGRRGPPHRPLAAITAWLGRAIATELTIRRSIRELAAMPERGLHDLGLSRGEIERVTRHGRL